jgi:hypothetical protein
MGIKKPGKMTSAGPEDYFLDKRLSGSLASGSSNALSSDGFTLFTPFILTWFFIAFFKLEPLEKPIVLNLLFQNPHGLFQIVVKNLDLNFLHLFRPLLYHPIPCLQYQRLQYQRWFISFIYFLMVSEKQSFFKKIRTEYPVFSEKPWGGRKTR